MRKPVVAGIDLGTTYSGYSIFIPGNNKQDGDKIHTFSWRNGFKNNLKTPTVALFDQNKIFHSFGNRAEEKYCTLMKDGNHAKWYMFRGFRKVLHQAENLSLRTFVKDVTGKEMLAIEVFTAVIQHIKGQILNYFNQVLMDRIDEEINWAISVPTFWSDAAKQFIRIASERAGIPSNQLRLIYEPDAALLYCHSQYKTMFDVTCAGSMYLLLDCGGGSIDITVHQVQKCGKLLEVLRVCGGEWGGYKVNETFFAFMSEIYGCDITTTLKNRELFNLDWEFESLKEHTRPNYLFETNELSGFSFNLPKTLRQSSGPVYKNGYGVSIKGSKLRIDLKTMSSLFKQTLNNIVQQIRSVVEDPRVQNLKTIYMVGGFSECPLLQSCVKREFLFQVLTPKDASAAIVKGSVLCIHNPEMIKYWVSPLTYGIRKQTVFKHGHHDPDKLKTIDGKKKCVDLFDIYIQKGETLEYNQVTEFKSYCPVKAKQKIMRLHVYASNNRYPTYTSDPGCTKLGNIFVKMPDISNGKQRRVDVKMIVGRTELKVKAVDQTTGKKYSARFDFLQTL